MGCNVANPDTFASLISEVREAWHRNTFPLALSPFAKQQEIVQRADKLLALANKIEAHYLKTQSYIDRLTPSLLAKAFRRELIPLDQKDDPASILLERIKATK